jgi:lipopolysaccharide biosynthesis glycosyltransferase
VYEGEELVYCMEQDILSVLYSGDVKILDPTWNYQVNPNISTDSVKHPKIIHFAGPDKPYFKENYEGEFSKLFNSFKN